MRHGTRALERCPEALLDSVAAGLAKMLAYQRQILQAVAIRIDDWMVDLFANGRGA